MQIELWVSIVLFFIVTGILVYWVGLRDWLTHRKAKREIMLYIQSYRAKLTGENRFVVTVETLQAAFIEYETAVIQDVWIDLVQDKIIEQDPRDGEWSLIR